MVVSKSSLVNGVLVAVIAAGTLAATSAAAKSYVVCNDNQCWRVHEKYTNYPADVHVTFHDDAWYAKHQHDTQWHFQADPTDDHGWYDKDGTWHAFEPHP